MSKLNHGLDTTPPLASVADVAQCAVSRHPNVKFDVTIYIVSVARSSFTFNNMEEVSLCIVCFQSH